jgi:hypothetical protein
MKNFGMGGRKQYIASPRAPRAHYPLLIVSIWD